MPERVPWSEERLAYTHTQRQKIMACIQRNNNRERTALDAIPWTRPDVRAKVRDWHHAYWSYLLGEYEKVLPHVDELPSR